MVRVKAEEEAEISRQFESTKNGMKNCKDMQALYNICKAYTNFLERIARKYDTTVNGMQPHSDAN